MAAASWSESIPVLQAELSQVYWGAKLIGSGLRCYRRNNSGEKAGVEEDDW